MSISSQYYEAIADYAGVEGDTNYISVMKGDVVRLIKNDKEWLTVDKYGDIGKVPKGILVQNQNYFSQVDMNFQESISQHAPETMQLNYNQNNSQLKQLEIIQQSSNPNQFQNNNSQINSVKPINNQQSQIISLHSNNQIKQQSENQQQQKINLKPETELINVKQEIIQKDELSNIESKSDRRQQFEGQQESNIIESMIPTEEQSHIRIIINYQDDLNNIKSEDTKKKIFIESRNDNKNKWNQQYNEQQSSTQNIQETQSSISLSSISSQSYLNQQLYQQSNQQSKQQADDEIIIHSPIASSNNNKASNIPPSNQTSQQIIESLYNTQNPSQSQYSIQRYNDDEDEQQQQKLNFNTNQRQNKDDEQQIQKVNSNIKIIDNDEEQHQQIKMNESNQNTLKTDSNRNIFKFQTSSSSDNKFNDNKLAINSNLIKNEESTSEESQIKEISGEIRRNQETYKDIDEQQQQIDEDDQNKEEIYNEDVEEDDHHNNNQLIDFDLLNLIIKDIPSIIESNTINDEEKQIKIRELFNELKKKDKDELRNIFNIEAYKLIRSYINNCNSGIEKILLDMIELVAEKGIQWYDSFNPSDPIFNNIQSSGLFNKIQQLIKDKIENEKVQKKYSEEIDQLTRINIQIMKGRETYQQMIDFYTKVINKNINNLLNTINKLKEEYNKEINNLMNKEEIESEIKQQIQLIKVISMIRDQDPNNFYNETRIPDQIINVIKERIVPLIHINCPTEINCQQCINIPQFPAVIDLKFAVIYSLAEVSQYNQEIKSIIQEDNIIIAHLTPSIIQFASQYQLNKKISPNEQQHQQQSEQSTSPSLIISSLSLLWNLIKNNDISKIMIQTPNLLHYLIQLNRYNINNHINEEEDEEALSIRKQSGMCLYCILRYGDESTQYELVSSEFAVLQVLQVSTAGGDGEQEGNEIANVLGNISKFLQSLHQGRKTDEFNQIPSFPQQISLARRLDEQIEEEGGNEEIESQLINKKIYDVTSWAKDAKGALLNLYIDKSNTISFWYEEDQDNEDQDNEDQNIKKLNQDQNQ